MLTTSSKVYANHVNSLFLAVIHAKTVKLASIASTVTTIYSKVSANDAILCPNATTALLRPTAHNAYKTFSQITKDPAINASISFPNAKHVFLVKDVRYVSMDTTLMVMLSV